MWMRLQLLSMAIGNAKSVRDPSLLMVVRLMRWQTGFMLGLLEQSRVVSVGGGIAFLGSFVSKTLQLLMGDLILGLTHSFVYYRGYDVISH